MARAVALNRRELIPDVTEPILQQAANQMIELVRERVGGRS